MSAQDYANTFEEISVMNGEDQMTSINQTQDQSSNHMQDESTNGIMNGPNQSTSLHIRGRIRKAKVREEGIEEEDDENDKGKGVENDEGRDQQQKKKAKVNEIEHLIMSPVAGGALTGLGRTVEDMQEPVQIELGHKKWIHNVTQAALRFDTNQVSFLKHQYKEWCEEEKTTPRKIDLHDLDFETWGINLLAETSRAETTANKEIITTKKDSNTTMNVGNKMLHLSTKLSKYWHDVMISKNIHVPVSIFSPKWLIQDTNYMRSRRVKPSSCMSDVIPYIGSPVTHEFRLSFAEWTVRYNLMVNYQATKYDILDNQKDSPIAPRLIAHRDNVLQIQIDHFGKWPIAMRYDVAHRRNIWENRLADGTMADVGTLNKELVDQAEREAKHYGDYAYDDNPYVFGGPLQNIGPHNGLTYPENNSWDVAGAMVDNQAEMVTGKTISVWNRQPNVPVVTERTVNKHISNNGKISTYKGTKFDPNYHLKQQNKPTWMQNNQYHNQNQRYMPFNNDQNNGFNQYLNQNRPNSFNQYQPNNQFSYSQYQSQPYQGYGSGRSGSNRGGNGGVRRGSFQHSGGRPGIGPGSFKRLLIENGQSSKDDSHPHPVALSSK